MIKKIISFFDRHRLILVLLILFLISVVFLGVKSYMFLNMKFQKIHCLEKIDEIYCYNNNLKIFVDAEASKKDFFENNSERINEFKKEYDLPEFNFYNAYYYEVVALLNYNYTGEDEGLYNFFDVYSNTYNLEKIYKENSFYYNIFYSYKIF